MAMNLTIAPYIGPGLRAPWIFDTFLKHVLPPLTHPPQGNFTWHVMQSSATMTTALLGALVRNYLGSRVERREREEHKPGPLARS